MTAVEIIEAMGYIGDREIIELCSYIYKKRDAKGRSARRLFRILIAAAAIISALGLTAYAVSSLHRQRQEELRRQYRVEENNVSSYVEYPEPTVQTGASLVSAISDGQFQKLFVNISPVTEEELWRGLNGFYFAYRIESDESYTMANVAFDWDKLSDEDLVDVYDEDTGQSFEAYDKQRLFELCLEDYYDPETLTLTVECNILKSRIDETKPVEITMVSLIDGMAKIKEYGTLVFDCTQTQTRRIVFPEPVAFENPELGEMGYIIGVELYPTGMAALMTVENVERLFGNCERSNEEVRMQTSWHGPMDMAVSSGRLFFSDGSEKAFPGILGSPLKNGYITCYGNWDATIDIDDVVALEIMGHRMETE